MATIAACWSSGWCDRVATHFPSVWSKTSLSPSVKTSKRTLKNMQIHFILDFERVTKGEEFLFTLISTRVHCFLMLVSRHIHRRSHVQIRSPNANGKFTQTDSYFSSSQDMNENLDQNSVHCVVCRWKIHHDKDLCTSSIAVIPFSMHCILFLHHSSSLLAAVTWPNERAISYS